MRGDARDIRRFLCPACDNEQHIDVLGPTAAARQREHLHGRGVERLRRAIAND